MLAMSLAYAVARGKDFLGHPTNGNYYNSVLYIQTEMPEWLVADRLAKLLAAGDDIQSPLVSAEKGIYQFDFKALKLGINLSFLWPDHKNLTKDIEEAIRKTLPTLIIIDPLYSFTSSDLVANSEVQPLLYWLDSIKETSDSMMDEPTSLVVVHHNAKASKVSAGKAMLGSVFLHGWAEAAWYVSPRKDGILINREFRAYPPLYPITCQFDIKRPGQFGYTLKAK